MPPTKVRASVPSRQLLVFETGKHGYQELARFLGVPEPPKGTPYPRTNAKADFAFIIAIYRALAALTLAMPAALLWFVSRRVKGAGGGGSGSGGGSSGKNKPKLG